MALKYSGIYKMLPVSVCGWIDSCDYGNKKEALRLLAEITEKSGFDTAVNALEKTLEYGVFDTDSVKSFYKRLSIDNQLIEKLLLPLSVSDPKPINSDVSVYDSFPDVKAAL